MADARRLSETLLRQLRCPICQSQLRVSPGTLQCVNASCGMNFPVFDECPILLNEATSVFSFDDFRQRRNLFFDLNPGKFHSFVTWLLPTLSLNVKTRPNFERLAALLSAESQAPRVLVVGGSILGSGMEAIVSVPGIEFAETDVSLGPRTMLICDAHDLPFEAGTFDAVIIQAVLEHVVDPQRCVEQCFRVLKPSGLIYAETPFMQQVHGGCYDFTRYTLLGHRRLFRRFTEIESGAACGPGMALAWSYRYFLLSFTSSRRARQIVSAFARFTSFFLKYFDPFLIDKPAALDAASGVYFLGRKSDLVLGDRELIRMYRGLL
jgi:SAM-dependent methyltransferase